MLLRKNLARCFRRFMAIDVSPPVWNGQPGILEREAFSKAVTVLAAQIPANKTGLFLKAPELRGSLLDLAKIKCAVPNPSDPETGRLILLRATDLAEITPDALAFLKRESIGISPYTFVLEYDYWTADDILQAILPESLREESPTGFSVAGHIGSCVPVVEFWVVQCSQPSIAYLAHLNLNQEYLPFKHTIGQIILDKNPKVRTVVNKLDSIDSKFRFFKMEVLAGDEDFIVHHSESDCRFTFDFSKVYWNSRLHMEHGRLVDLFSSEDVVVDVFAGVGPFAVPAGKKGIAVLANDLNPDSYKYLAENIIDNRVGEDVRAFCQDGRDFIPFSAQYLLENPLPPYNGPVASLSQVRRKKRIVQLQRAEGPPRNQISHFVMNLPDSALTFLDAFRGIFASDALKNLYGSLPMIHCYCFTRELDPELARVDIIKRAESSLGHSLEDDVALHMVRSVAPNKNMYCLSFRLPSKAAFEGRV